MLDDIAGLDIFTDPATTDFGGLSRGNSRVRVRPTSTSVLLALVARARRDGIALTARTLGLSQSGQSLAQDGVSVDMSSFQGIEIRGDRVWCGSAVTWRQLLESLAPIGMAPEVVPFNLDLSVGGTLCAGGMGSSSHRHGMAANSVEGLEVVTGAGEFLRATRDNNVEVLDAVLGGIGMFGFITAVTLRLRAMAPRVRTTFLLYHTLPRMLVDQRRLSDEGVCTHIEGFASAAIQGMRLGTGGRRVPFARWFYGLQVSNEHDPDEQPDDSWLSCLNFDEIVWQETADSLEHASRYDPRFHMMRGSGLWDQNHPWLECMFPHDAGVELISEIIPKLPVGLGDGHRILMIADVPRPRLLMQPDGPVLGLAILPAGVAPGMLDTVMPALRDVHDRCIAAGGKRYLSGWLFEPDEDAWRTHYGPHYDSWRSSKALLDPDSIFRSVLRPTPTWL